MSGPAAPSSGRFHATTGRAFLGRLIPGLLVQGTFLGPLISTAGSRKMAVMWWWKPFQQDDVAFLKQLIEAGGLAPVIDRSYPLSDVPKALRHLEEGLARGKVVITV